MLKRMNRYSFCLAAIALSVFLPQVIGIAQTGISAGVVRLSDGDTARVDTGLITDVRIACIDAPEVPRSKKEASAASGDAIAQFKYGRLAQARISNLLATVGSEIRVIPIGGASGTEGVDRYGRNIASVAFQDGSDWAERLVSEGLALVYEQYANAGCDKQKLLELQAIAKEKGLGVWSEPGIPPWEFRAKKR